MYSRMIRSSITVISQTERCLDRRTYITVEIGAQKDVDAIVS